MKQPLRFKDLEIGQLFRIQLAGQWVVAEKIAVDKLETLKWNSPGTVKIPINPELNEEDIKLYP